MTKNIKFNCPACRKELKVSPQLLGKRMQCVRCADIFYLKKVSREKYLEYQAQIQSIPGEGSDVIQFDEDSDDDLPIAELVD